MTSEVGYEGEVKCASTSCKCQHSPKFQALDILVRQMNYNSPDVVPVVLDQLTKSAVWKYRVDAAKLLVHLGKLLGAYLNFTL